MDNNIYFHLPGFYHHYTFNLLFLSYFINNKKKFYDNIQIGSFYDSFPGTIWDGGRVFGEEIHNETSLSPQIMQQILNSFNSYDIPCRFTFTNSLLTKNHLNDIIGNISLQLAYNGNNQVTINSDILENYIRERYPKFPLISSTTKVLRDNISSLENELNKDYFLVVPDYSFNNTDELFKISNKEKCEILVNDSCHPKCEYRKRHYQLYSKVNIERSLNCLNDFSCAYPDIKNQSFYKLLKNNPAHITVDNLYNKYVKAGFRNFKIIGRTDEDSSVMEYYLYYMVKPEYKQEIFSEMIMWLKKCNMKPNLLF